MYSLVQTFTAILTLICFLSLVRLNQALQNDSNITPDFTQTASTISLRSVQFLTTLAGNGDDQSSSSLSASTLTSLLKKDRVNKLTDDVGEDDADEDESDDGNETVLAKLNMPIQMVSIDNFFLLFFAA